MNILKNEDFIENLKNLFNKNMELDELNKIKFNIIWMSIWMASRNSSMKRNEMANAYCKKTLNKFILWDRMKNNTKPNYETIEYFIENNIENGIETLGRAMHNLTYLDGELKTYIKSINNDKIYDLSSLENIPDLNNLYIVNEYKKLGMNKIFVRKQLYKDFI